MSMSISRIFSFATVVHFRKFTNISKINASTYRRMATIEKVIENNKRNEEILISVKHELEAMRLEMMSRRKHELRAENAELQRKVEQAKQQLIALELRSGKKQIAVPGARNLCTQAGGDQQVTLSVTPTTASSETIKSDDKAPKEKKPKKEKTAAAPTAVAEAPIDVGRLDMRVGKIIEVERHPDADSLYLEKIDCGEAKPRTVVSGLVKFVPLEEMQNRMVVVLCNLKPAKMRGVTSEAMVMCASTPEKVEVLSPPAGAVPGDLVHCDGYTRQPDAQLNPKKKIFETCAPDLMTNADLVACYKGSALSVPGKGNVVSQTLKNVNVK